MSKGGNVQKTNHNPLVGGSNPSGATSPLKYLAENPPHSERRKSFGGTAGDTQALAGCGVLAHLCPHCAPHRQRKAMSEKVRNDARDQVRFLQSQPDDVRMRENARGRAVAEAEHREFQGNYRVGKCSICGDELSSFDRDAPCVHWLLRPAGFTKHDFPPVAERYGLFHLQNFLRWVANEDGVARNINDLSDEGTGKLVELTIRHGDCEWAFACGEGDYMGHESESEDSRRPHYHFQMRYKRQAFIRYNDFHIPLSDFDIRTIEMARAAPGFVRPKFAGGEGMSDLLTEGNLQRILENTVSTPDESEALLNFQTMVVADPGKPISGETLLALFDEAKQKGVSIASLVPKLENVSAQTLVIPGPGVVEQAPRTGRKRRGNSDDGK